MDIVGNIYFWGEYSEMKAIFCAKSWTCRKTSLWILLCPLSQQGIVKPCGSHPGLRADVIPPVKKVVQVRGIKCILE